MVAAKIQGPCCVIAVCLHEPARIEASSQGGLPMLAIVHCLRNTPGTNGLQELVSFFETSGGHSIERAPPSIESRRTAAFRNRNARTAPASGAKANKKNPLWKLPLASLSRPIA